MSGQQVHRQWKFYIYVSCNRKDYNGVDNVVQHEKKLLRKEHRMMNILSILFTVTGIDMHTLGTHISTLRHPPPCTRGTLVWSYSCLLVLLVSLPAMSAVLVSFALLFIQLIPTVHLNDNELENCRVITCFKIGIIYPLVDSVVRRDRLLFYRHDACKQRRRWNRRKHATHFITTGVCGCHACRPWFFETNLR